MHVGERAIFIDMTTSYQERGRHPHGSTRVERGLVLACAGLNEGKLRFCRFNALTGDFIELPRDEAIAIAAAPTLAEARREPRSRWRRSRLLQVGKDLEGAFRTKLRDPIRSRLVDLARRVRPSADAAARPSASPFPPGSVLVLPGELQRHDFRALVRIKRERALDLVVVHHDLLGVLPKGDPRLHDPSRFDLPGSDFSIREAALIVANSKVSKDILLASCAERGLRGPPAEVLRLGHDIPGVRLAPEPVPGLTPGRFVLAVGDHSPRKNFALLIDVWEDMLARRTDQGMRLVLVGKIAQLGTALVDRVNASPALKSAVLFLPNVDDRGLQWLYANCRFTAFPSRLEGFGLPAAESLGAGKVCVASNTSAIPEATQGVAILFDPDDRAGWVAAIERLIADEGHLRDEEARIKRDYRPVTWRDTAEDMLAAIARWLPERRMHDMSTAPSNAEATALTS
jgi:glycosyltransferase involved in cell wall biosynthesis